MSPVAWIFLALFVAVLTAAVLAVRRVRRKLEGAYREIDVLENHNRAVEDQRRRVELDRAALASKLAETERSFETLRGRSADLETANAELDRQNAEIDRQNAELVSRNSALDRDLAALRAEHERLRKGVFGFQVDWRHQLATVEEEMETVVRQIGEFRKGTRLPLEEEGLADEVSEEAERRPRLVR